VDLTFGPQEDAFRAEVRKFFAEHLPLDVAKRQRSGFLTTSQDMRAWQQILFTRGWGAPAWPVRYGGTGWSPVQRYIFDDETGAHDAPDPSPVGVNLVGPVIYSFGSEAMKGKYLDAILRGEILFCQGFTEPGAGSDLARLKTEAIPCADGFLISGSKIWISDAHFADRMICLARTSKEAKPQAGLSMFIVSLRAPGVTVRPIRSINGESVINEVFLDEVRVTHEDLVGEINQGWSYTKFLLTHERTRNASVPRIKRDIALVRQRANARDAIGRNPIGDPYFLHRLAQLEIEVAALDWAVLRAFMSDGTSPTRDAAAASALKIRGSELLLQVSELKMELLGDDVLPFLPGPQDLPCETAPIDYDDDSHGVTSQYLYRRASTIFGGTNDIQRSLIWKNVIADGSFES